MIFRKWLSGLPTEYQLAIVFGLAMLFCFFVTPLSLFFDKNLSVIVEGLGALAVAALAHGGVSRFGKPDATKDIMGDTK